MQDPRYRPGQGTQEDVEYWIAVICQRAAFQESEWEPASPPVLLLSPFPPGYPSLPTDSMVPSSTPKNPWYTLPETLQHPPPPWIHYGASPHDAPPAPIRACSQGSSTLLAVCVGVLILGLCFWMAGFFAPFPTPTASQEITRIDQWGSSQYNDSDQYKYAPSACSTAAMTEVIDAYGHDYRLADILAAEIRVNAISVDLGLLSGYQSIRDTVASFDFTAKDLSGPASDSLLDRIIKTAKEGKPVIVGWPPALWQGGHLLVVRGGDSQNVLLVDSSTYHFTSLPRSIFRQRWVGFAVLIEPKK